MKIINLKDFQSLIQQTIEYIKHNSRSNYSINFFEWQYDNEKSHLFVIYDNTTILGTQGMIGYDFIFSGRKCKTHKSETTFVSDELRGSGYFEKLYKESVDKSFSQNSELIWGFTALGKVWEKKLGFHYVDDLVYESNLVFGLKSNKNGFRNLIDIYKFTKTRFRMLFIKNISYRINIENISDLNFVDKFNSFYKDGSVYLDYESDSLKNRVYRAPLDYKKLNVFLGNELKLILLLSENDFEVKISDIFYNLTNLNELGPIFKGIINYLYTERNITKLSFWGNYYCSEYQHVFKIFKKMGGEIQKVDNMQFIYQLKNKSNKIDDISYLYVNGLWTEGFYW